MQVKSLGVRPEIKLDGRMVTSRLHRGKLLPLAVELT